MIKVITVLPMFPRVAPKATYSYNKIQNKSASNRKKYSIIRMMKRRRFCKYGPEFNKDILSAPVPDFIKRMPEIKKRVYNSLVMSMEKKDE